MGRLAADRRTHGAQIDAVLTRSTQETHALGAQGTPVFLLGRDLVTSSVNLQALLRLVALARTEQRSASH